MSQNYNVITLKKNKELNLSEINKKSFLYSLEFLNALKRSFTKKGIVVISSQINFITNTCFVRLKLYYKTFRVLNYKNKINSLKVNFKHVNRQKSFISSLNKSFSRTKKQIRCNIDR